MLLKTNMVRYQNLDSKGVRGGGVYPVVNSACVSTAPASAKNAEGWATPL